jgi:hypothetical protein
MKMLYTPSTRDLCLLHQKRLAVPEFAKWWARYIHLAIGMKSARSVKLRYTEEELAEVCQKAFAALPPELLDDGSTK